MQGWRSAHIRFYWPLREQLWVQAKATFPIHTPYNPRKWLLASLMQDCCQVHTVDRSRSTKGGEMASWGERQSPGDYGILLCPGSTTRWRKAWKMQKWFGLLPGTATQCDCGDLCGRNTAFHFQWKPKHNSHRGLPNFKCNTDGRYSARKLPSVLQTTLTITLLIPLIHTSTWTWSSQQTCHFTYPQGACSQSRPQTYHSLQWWRQTCP